LSHDSRYDHEVRGCAFVFIVATECARDATTEEPHPHHQSNVAGSVANCSSLVWYPGVTETIAPRHTLELGFVDQMGDGFRPVDICLVIDEKSMLRQSDFDVVVQGLARTKSVTWRGTVSPGKHHLRIHLSFRTDKARFEVKSTHEIDVQEDGRITAVAFAKAERDEALPVVQWHATNSADAAADANASASTAPP
jgi:hypothetical protein